MIDVDKLLEAMERMEGAGADPEEVERFAFKAIVLRSLIDLGVIFAGVLSASTLLVVGYRLIAGSWP